MRAEGTLGAPGRRRNMLVIVLALVSCTLLAMTASLGAGPAVAVSPRPADSAATLILFHGEGCPHCAAEREWLEGLAGKYPAMTIEQHEVWNDEANRALLAQYAQDLGFEPSGVPVTIVGEQVWIGFSEPIAAQIEAAVVAAVVTGEPGAGGGAGTNPDSGAPGAAEPEDGVTLPLVGTVSLAGSSLVVSTLLIGFADGINPCSLWVLAVLLAIVLHSGSRGRVLLVGSTFLLVTAGMYGLYIVGMYSALDYASGLTWIRVAVAVVAMILGVLQLKDGLAPGVGPSLSISPAQRPRLYRTMRGVSRADRGLVGTLAGTAALAVGVSLLETPCTAGLPLLWTSMLADQGVSTATAVTLFGLYMAVFLLDELVLFVVAVVTMRAAHLQQKQGQALKILSGSLLVTLATAMLVAPEALTGLASSLVVFAAAGVLALVMWLVAGALRPEPEPPSRSLGPRQRPGH